MFPFMEMKTWFAFCLHLNKMMGLCGGFQIMMESGELLIGERLLKQAPVLWKMILIYK